jgi:hypothetical protein
MPRKARQKKEDVEVLGLLGVGLDKDEGHLRLTTGEHFVMYGGSEETHDRMVDTAIHVNEELRKRGKTLHDASVEEIADLFREKGQ